MAEVPEFVRSAGRLMWHRVRPDGRRSVVCCGMTIAYTDVWGNRYDIEGDPYCSRCALWEHKRRLELEAELAVLSGSTDVGASGASDG